MNKPIPTCKEGDSMNSWETIKDFFLREKDPTPGSMGYHIEVDRAARLFTKLRPLLSDEDAATSTLDDDKEVREAFIAARASREFRREMGWD